MAVLSRLLRASALTASCSLYAATVRRRGLSLVASEGDLRLPSSAHLSPLGTRKDLTGRNVQWAFLGCPGVGKGTYASRLSQLLGVPHIATGDLVREELSSSGPLADQLRGIVNQGKLVSDEIIVDLLSKRVEKGEAKGESGFILDGFPRTLRQAEILERVTDVDLVINLKLREDVLLEKCLGRRICSQCGGNFNIACIDIKGEDGKPGIYMAPLLPPEGCASKLVTRSDDTEEVVKERLRIYNEMVRSVALSAAGGIPESWPKLLHALHLDGLNREQSLAA
ncbi:unnamed protein product [Spirodela intermedia]|uniref:adenylate kinase n=1 Tax=Spirodela intermedia TaxID=51605 RepID=A0A7I8JUS3_SPIIN|nr:unnamed protein product [Spirodela intermedia]CAA6673495.1 unnamed protein product [Spirodela intermedia]